MFCKARMANALTSITRIKIIKQISKQQQQQRKYEKGAVVCFSHFLNIFMTQKKKRISR